MDDDRLKMGRSGMTCSVTLIARQSTGLAHTWRASVRLRNLRTTTCRSDQVLARTVSTDSLRIHVDVIWTLAACAVVVRLLTLSSRGAMSDVSCRQGLLLSRKWSRGNSRQACSLQPSVPRIATMIPLNRTQKVVTLPAVQQVTTLGATRRHCPP